jgi:hypothetical protein
VWWSLLVLRAVDALIGAGFLAGAHCWLCDGAGDVVQRGLTKKLVLAIS